MRSGLINIIYKQDYVLARKMAEEIAVWLRARSIPFMVIEAGEKATFSDDPKLALVLGGDGTILGAARRLAGTDAPILGINFGRVGFLTTLDVFDWQTGLEQALAGKLPERSCTALQWKILRKVETVAAGVAINDVVVGRGPLARLANIHVAINGEDMGTLRSDGIIASSPLGSSGYAASAGGPTLHPDMDAICLTPICSYMPHAFPLVMPSRSVFELTVASGASDCYLTIDGQEGQKIERGDHVRINGWPGAIHFLGSEAHFFTRLRSRGFSLD